MVKTLRITSIVAAILAVVFFVSVFVFGTASDREIVQFLATAGVVEQAQARGDKARPTDSESSPLVKQAQAFALYLNPPKPEKPPVTVKITTPRPAVVSPKFKLIGTSVHQSHPELSMALIDEPGKGLHWVRQGSQVGRLIIQQVKNGLIVVRDNEKTFNLEVTGRPERRSLLKSSAKEIRSSKFEIQNSSPRVRGDEAFQISAEEQILSLKKTIAELKAMEAQLGAGKPGSYGNVEQERALIREFISDLEAEAMRISAEEAKKLGRLGKNLSTTRMADLSDLKKKEELEDADKDPNQER